MGSGVLGSGFGIWGFRFGVWGLGFGVQGLGFDLWGLRSRVWGACLADTAHRPGPALGALAPPLARVRWARKHVDHEHCPSIITIRC